MNTDEKAVSVLSVKSVIEQLSRSGCVLHAFAQKLHFPKGELFCIKSESATSAIKLWCFLCAFTPPRDTSKGLA